MSFPRPSSAFVVATLSALTALAACTSPDSSTRPPSPVSPSAAIAALTIPGCNTGKVAQIASSLLPAPDRDFDLQRSVTTVLVLTPTQLAVARSLTLRLAGALNDDRILALLRDPNGSAPPTKGEAISSLVNELFACVQLPSPGNIAGAYAPGGAVKVVGAAGGDVIARDSTAGFRVPSGAVSEDHLFTVQRKSDLARLKQCLPNTPGQYNDCYGFSVFPATTFLKPVLLVMCTLQDADNPYGTPSLAVHERLRMASLDHSDPTNTVVRVYDRVPDVVGLDCAHHVSIAQAPTSLRGRFAAAAARLASALLSPVTPRTANAFDGAGCLVNLLTDFTTVDPVQLSSGFEPGEASWSTGGFWQASTFAGLANQAYPSLVSLGAGDASAGALPAAFGGTQALWFGEAATGNFAGTLANLVDGGGSSTGPRSGEAVSPTFQIVNSSNPVQLKFQSWFEIESQNPSHFDLMSVLVEDVATGALSPLVTLNPATDPTYDGGRARLPFTSGGFNTAPVWQLQRADLSAFRGKSVRLHFRFDTRDSRYNAFRGWIVDDVAVTVGSERAPFFLRAVAPVATLSPTEERVWQP